MPSVRTMVEMAAITLVVIAIFARVPAVNRPAGGEIV